MNELVVELVLTVVRVGSTGLPAVYIPPHTVVRHRDFKKKTMF